jgi:periplasmic divalent cation tolerance protein
MTEPVSDSGSSVVAVLTTAPDAEVADRIGTALVDERLAACANLVHGVISIFRWKGEVRREGETLMVLKTTAARLSDLRRRLVELHPYEVPEVIALDIREGHPPYLDWVRAEVEATSI